ncbi:MAG: transketolase [Acidobacteriota bacterium]
MATAPVYPPAGRTPSDPAGDRALAALAVATLRTLSMDAVQAANSGHPGTPMAMAPVLYTLWQRVLRFDPDHPAWANRDRFVLSIGHASALIYAMLHVAGVKAVDAAGEPVDALAVPLDHLRRFRQLDSRCPGHPEYRWTAGIEATTGPLGQGVAMSVGMAAAATWQAARYNRPGFTLFDHDVYALCGDGCLMEGVAAEAASLAGHLRLDNLCWIYDNNRITIEGATSLAFSEDVAARFAAYGWHVVHVADANDLDALTAAFDAFRATAGRPTLVIVDSHIAYGAPHKVDTSAAHGEPLGDEEVRLAKRAYGWPEDAAFRVPPEVVAHLRHGVGARGRAAREAWEATLAGYESAYPQLGAEVRSMLAGALPDGWDDGLEAFPPGGKGVSGRDASGQVLNALARRIPWLVGGSADLAPSTKTRLTGAGEKDFGPGAFDGRNVHFGVREHAMGAVLNGLALSKIRPFGSGFLVFSDYARPAIRLSALMELPTVHIFTHDSIGVGEDGPTHQPVEHLASLRAVPGLVTLRPADANEVVEAWRVIMGLTREPVALVLTRQPLPTLDRTRYAPASGVSRGAYVLADPASGEPALIFLATGSEVALCVEAHERLAAKGVPTRVVSMPSWELFERQPAAYRAGVLPPHITARVAVEQASPLGWDRYVGPAGAIVGMRTFGASAPFQALQQKFGFTVDHVLAVAREQLR